MQFIWPLDDYIITRDFYYKASLYVGGQHAALDLIRKTGSTQAAPIRAVASGTVAGVGWDMYSGFFVAVDHAGGWRSIYRHLYRQTPVVVGQQVSRGQIIGNVGNTGWSQGDHLHFDLWSMAPIEGAFEKNGIWAVDPALYLGQEEDEMEEDQMQEIRELVAGLAAQLTAVRIHQSASDEARDTHVSREAKSVKDFVQKAGEARAKEIKDAMPSGGSVSKETIKQAIKELVN